MATKSYVIIAGVGSGTAASIARVFAKSYPIALLARKTTSYENLAREINDSGGRAVGIPTDVSIESSVKAAVEKIEEEFGHGTCAAAIYQASGGFVRKPFLDTKVEDLEQSWNVTVKGAMIFSQAILPSLLKHAEDAAARYPPTLIFTGATASVKANAQMATFAAPKWALRGLSMSLAREFAPRGVHVAHAIIDGAIDIPTSQDMLRNLDVNARIGPDDIAETYWNLHTQSKRGFTNEIDIRPMLEKW